MFAIGKDRLGIFKHSAVSSHAIARAIERIDLIAVSRLVQFFKHRINHLTRLLEEDVERVISRLYLKPTVDSDEVEVEVDTDDVVTVD